MSKLTTRAVAVFSGLIVVGASSFALMGCAVGVSDAAAESTPEAIGNGPDVVRTGSPDEGQTVAASAATSKLTRLAAEALAPPFAQRPTSYAGYDRAARGAERASLARAAAPAADVLVGESGMATVPVPPGPSTAVDCAGEATDLATDPANCGACGTTCLGVACRAGLCVSITR